MIAAIAFPVAGVMAWLHYRFGPGAMVLPGATVWVMWFFVVLLASGIDCARAQDAPSTAAWMVMAIGWALSILTWKISANPMLDLAAKNVVLGAILIGIAYGSGHRPILYAVGFAHLALIAVAFAATVGIVPGAGQRPRQFVAWSYPDIAAAVQHLCLIVVGGFASGEPAWVDRLLGMVRGDHAGRSSGVAGAARDRGKP